jgi:acyl carrier protein
VSPQEINSRIENAFLSVFGRHVRFDPQLERAGVPRWTSLRHVEFIVALEREFGIRFDGADATDMVSIPVVMDRIRQRLT